ncbi:GNAT family N-acetyltransferase [Micromonospora sp. NPDC051006]|uniref:GNAT family N-acetyltransferase n=1 Tax=Micromonospora sp. NPDC051006 TaxID=3364283 RepID=UPI0037902BD0
MRSLTSKRLRLREWCDDDADFVLDLCSRWEVQRFIGAKPRVIHDHDEALATIARWRGREEGMHGVWAVEDRHSGQLLGTLLLVGILASSDREPLPPTGETEIGWYFHPHAWGHGYAGEAAQTVLRYAFDAGLQTVLAVTHPDNTASQAVCRRLGMEHRGQTRRYYNMTCELFAVTKPPGSPGTESS